ncbi:hypothetical protein FS837_010151, partial [Tulasnella sp. UAMH 9824]
SSIGAIQIETGRVKSKEKSPPSESPAHVFADCLRSFGKVVEESGEDGPTEQAILLPDGQTSMWLSKWEMECQVLTDGDSLSDAGPPITAVDSDTPSKTRALPESIQYPVEGMGESATAGSQPHICDSQDLSATVEDPSFIGYEEEDPTFPSLDEQAVHQQNQQPPPTPTTQAATVVPAVRALDDAQLPPAKKKRRPHEVEPSSLDEVDDGTRKLRSTTASRAAQEPRPVPPATTSARTATSAGKRNVQATATARTTRSAATTSSAGRGRGGGPKDVSSAAPTNRRSSRHGR